jgi:hypothetical protein
MLPPMRAPSCGTRGRGCVDDNSGMVKDRVALCQNPPSQILIAIGRWLDQSCIVPAKTTWLVAPSVGESETAREPGRGRVRQVLAGIAQLRASTWTNDACPAGCSTCLGVRRRVGVVRAARREDRRGKRDHENESCQRVSRAGHATAKSMNRASVAINENRHLRAPTCASVPVGMTRFARAQNRTERS